MFRLSRLLVLCVGILSLLLARSASAQQNDPCSAAQSQASINACESDQYAKADAELNHVYRQLLSKYKSDAGFVTKLRLAQQSWLKFRDADVACFYYHKDKQAAYGSAYPACRSLTLTRLTVERTNELRPMLDPQEGDVCAFQAAPQPAQETQSQK